MFLKKSIFFFTAFMSFSNGVTWANPLTENLKAPYYQVQKESDGFHNDMMILNSGVAAFAKRIEMIRSAKKSIEAEYFIYALDETSKALTSELVLAAKRGVKVRILIDKSSAIFVFDEFYAKALKEQGVELRYYNDAALIRISSINFRNHRKLLVVDDRAAITGGRNIENDYFDYSEEFNFIDRDVYVEGDIVKTMRESFDKFFEHKIAERPELPKRPKDVVRRWTNDRDGRGFRDFSNEKAVKEYEERLKAARLFVSSTESDIELISKFEQAGQEVLSKSRLLNCPETTYATDAPGGTFATRLLKKYGDEFRHLRKVLFEKANAVDKGIVLSSPYIINSPKSMDIYQNLLDRGVSIDIYTNSLASTDAVYVAANLYPSLREMISNNIGVYLHSGQFHDEGSPLVADVTKAKWGTHSKTQLYLYQDSTQNEFMIGTYNYDNRSNHYNTEMALFCKGSVELFSDVQRSVDERFGHAYRIDKNLKAKDQKGREVSIYGASEEDLLTMRLISIPSRLLNLLL